MTKLLVVIAVVVIVAAAAGAALYLGGGGETKARSPIEQAIRDRQNHFKTMGAIMRDLGQQTKSGNIDQKKAAAEIDQLVVLGKQIPDWFPTGTGPQSGFKTHAKAEIWTDQSGFMKQYDDFMAEANRLVAAAAAGDTGELTGQYFTTGVACANCHKPYRVKMD